MASDKVIENVVLTDDEEHIYKDRIKVDRFDISELCNRMVKVTESFSGLPYLYPIQKKIAYRYFEIALSDETISLPISISRQRGKTELFRAIDATAMIFIPIIAKKFYKVFPTLEKFYNPTYPKNNGVWIGHMSNTEEQALALFNGVYNILSTEYAELIMADDEINVKAKKVRNTIKITNGSFLRWMSLHPQAKIESATFKIIQYDEAQDMNDSRYQKDASPMGAHWNAPEFFFGVAGTQPNFFHKIIKEGLRRNKSKNSGNKYCFYSDYQEGERESKYYKEYIRKKKKELGEESDDFQLSYNLKWLFEAGMAVTELIIKKNYRKELDLGIGSLRRGAELYFGLDFAKTNDKTVLTIGTKHWHLQTDDPSIAPPKQVIGIFSWHGTDYDAQFYDICDIIDEYVRESTGVPIKLVCDGTGVGDAISDRFVNRYEYEMEVEVVFYSLPMKHKLAKNLMTELRNGRMWIPYSDTARIDTEVKALIDEVKTIRKKLQGQYIICSHPDERGAHDDYWDSLSNMAWAAYLPGMTEAEEVKNQDFVTNPFRRRIEEGTRTSGIEEQDQFGRVLRRKPTYVNEMARK